MLRRYQAISYAEYDAPPGSSSFREETKPRLGGESRQGLLVSCVLRAFRTNLDVFEDICEGARDLHVNRERHRGAVKDQQENAIYIFTVRVPHTSAIAWLTRIMISDRDRHLSAIVFRSVPLRYQH